MNDKDYIIRDYFMSVYWLLAIVHFLQSVLKHLAILELDFALSILEALVLAVFIIVGALYLYRIRSRLIFRIPKDILLLIIIFILLVLSCLVRSISSDNNYLALNLSSLCEFVYLLLYFNLGKISARYGFKRVVINTFNIIMISITAFMTFVIYLTITNRVIEGSISGVIGMRDGYALEVNCNSNYVGASAMVFFLICIAAVIWYRNNRRLSIAYLICAVIHYVVLILSNSRTAFAAAIVGISCIIGLVSYYKLYKNMAKGRLRISCEISILTGEIVFISRYFTTYLYSLIVSIFNEFEFMIKEFTPEAVLSASSRLGIWGHCFSILFDPPLIFGLTPVGIATAIVERDSSLAANPHSHNIVLEMGLAVGIPGMILFVVWLLLIAKRCIMVLRSRPLDLTVMVIPFLILAMVVDNMFERYAIFYGFFVSYIFFFLCGFISYKEREISNQADAA